MNPYYEDKYVKLYHGDCREVLKKILPEYAVSAVVTDPPYGLGQGKTQYLNDEAKGRGFMGKIWDHGVPGEEFWKVIMDSCIPGASLLSFGGTRTVHRLVCAIEDAGWQIKDGLRYLYNNDPQMRELIDSLDEHQLEILINAWQSDGELMYVFGSGFPKSLSVGKAVDKVQGNERELVGTYKTPDGRDYTLEKSCQNGYNKTALSMGKDKRVERRILTKGNSEWEGWGSALKPAYEPICYAEKPREKISSDRIHEATGWDWWHHRKQINNTPKNREKILDKHGIEIPDDEREYFSVTRKALYEGVESDIVYYVKTEEGEEQIGRADVKPYREWKTDSLSAHALVFGVAGLNIDDCRISTNEKLSIGSNKHKGNAINFGMKDDKQSQSQNPQGRFPANVIHDDSEQVTDEFPESKGTANGGTSKRNTKGSEEYWGQGGGGFKQGRSTVAHGDSGNASRFYYTAKSSKSERTCGGVVTNRHPTVKPLSLLRYLITLVSMPEYNLVLDPFCGSGSTGVACKQLKIPCILIDSDEESCKTAADRLKWTKAGSTEFRKPKKKKVK